LICLLTAGCDKCSFSAAAVTLKFDCTTAAMHCNCFNFMPKILKNLATPCANRTKTKEAHLNPPHNHRL
jgi:hypothetical protein